ncbi:DMT family transporter [Jannaschia seohaensis]|uniref:EamA domain-containing membrane protein RarD n=1 Tax=Jannaschia seohaensis TaxID=475081 RepID=A0A2Y9C0B4_9RHOB|nr:DMT family transporter [Jannaschia seohaensis]PWJ19220.1 EamA domain-containing membrane protein RarD [Jannaschia seohaensis]SSA45882.1 EamA domain-containing membrane protein RarD [Jannaschia seohaensis]
MASPAPVSHLAVAREDNPGRGIALMLLAYLLFSFTDTSVKWLALAGLPALQLAFMRFSVHLVLSTGPMMGRDHSGFTAPPRLAAVMLFRGALLMVSTISNFVALTYLDLTLVAAIMFSSPIIVCALSVPLLGEQVGPWRWGAILVGFIGVLVVMRPWGADFHWAALASLTAATALAVFSILTRRLAGVAAPRTMQLYAGLVGTISLAPAAWFLWEAPATPLDWVLMVGIGVSAWAGHHFFSAAHGYAPASVLMPFSYSFLIYLAVLSFLVFGTTPDAMTILGAAIIAVAGLVIWWRERR